MQVICIQVIRVRVRRRGDSLTKVKDKYRPNYPLGRVLLVSFASVCLAAFPLE